MSDNDFPHKLIKGKIAELVFDQMFRAMGKFTVIPFGYESTLPEIAQSSHLVEYKLVLDQLRTAPDFAIVSHDKTEVFLVEVKYFTLHSEQEIKAIAEKIHLKWKVVWLFVATPHGFYFDSCSKIIRGDGKISRLTNNWVTQEMQDNYLEVLKDFIR